MPGCIGAVWRPQCPSFLASPRKKSRKVASPRPHCCCCCCLSYLSPNRSGGARQASSRISSNYFFGAFLSRGNNRRRRINTFYLVKLCLLFNPFTSLTTSSKATLLIILCMKIPCLRSDFHVSLWNTFFGQSCLFFRFDHCISLSLGSCIYMGESQTWLLSPVFHGIFVECFPKIFGN